MYKQLLAVAVTAILTASANAAWARDTQHDFSIADALGHPDAQAKLKIPMFFGSQSPGRAILNTIGEYRTSQKANAFGKGDEVACKRAMLSALLALQERAQKEGGNAVINIKSNYRNNETSSETTYVCGAGNIMAGVAFKGTVVKLKE
jgi:uncharacterized protein YbjQ (UPF0145 family)